MFDYYVFVWSFSRVFRLSVSSNNCQRCMCCHTVQVLATYTEKKNIYIKLFYFLIRNMTLLPSIYSVFKL